MNRRSKKHRFENVSYWESHADLMTALVLLVLLFLMLILLNLFELEEKNPNDYTGVDDIGISDYVEYLNHNHDYDFEHTQDASHNNSGGNGGGGSDGNGNYDEEPVEITEGNLKDAVLVQLIDEESNQLIKVEDISFELYRADGALVVLNTYYPEKVEYKTFETSSEGRFYLPEKIDNGSYHFHQITPIEGYDNADDTEFTLDKEYDWSKPYVVQIKVSPYRNTIFLSQLDKDSRLSVNGGSYDIYAAEDIVTKDGTIRYKKGEKVGTIDCNEDGEGKSEELFLGHYTLKQSVIPNSYIGLENEIPVEVVQIKEKMSKTEIECQRLMATVHLTEEKENLPIINAVYQMTCDEDPAFRQEYTTDYTGNFVLDTLERNHTYRLIQTEGPGHENPSDYAEHIIMVDHIGKVNGEIQPELNLTNRIIRIKIDTVSRIFKRHIKDHNIILRRMSDESIIESWSSSVGVMDLEGLQPGIYHIEYNNSDIYKEIIVEDVPGEQEYRFEVKDQMEIIVVGILSAASITVVIVALLSYLRSKKNKNREG